MQKHLILSIFLASSAPAMAFDLAGFLETMSLGTEVTTPSSGLEASVESAEARTTVRSEPVRTARPVNGGLDLDRVWLMGVFR